MQAQDKPEYPPLAALDVVLDTNVVLDWPLVAAVLHTGGAEPRSAVVAFSAEQVYALAEMLRRFVVEAGRPTVWALVHWICMQLELGGHCAPAPTLIG